MIKLKYCRTEFLILSLFIGLVAQGLDMSAQTKEDNMAEKIEYVVSGLDESQFSHLFDLSDAELAKIGAVREDVTVKPGYPCVISLEDAEVGEVIILMPYEHIGSNSPYQSKGPIFIRENVKQAVLENAVPAFLEIRTLSVRAYDERDMMVNARTIAGTELESFVQEAFQNPAAKYIHVHISSPGCFNCLVERK